MKCENQSKLKILRQATGRFDRRFTVGPAIWPHFDLLWLHEGAVALKIGAVSQPVELEAPSGVLIFPNVPFRGAARGAVAAASICHFTGGPFEANAGERPFLLPDPQRSFHALNLMRLSLEYANQGADKAVRARLLLSILDCFVSSRPGTPDAGRLGRAWAQAEARLSAIRNLTDVAAGVGLSESAFRALHRAAFGGSAGKHLQDVRLDKAERLLATTGDSVAQIAQAVGYAHGESLSHAFGLSRGRTPVSFRRWCKRFA